MDKVYQGKPVRVFGNIALPHSFTFINDFATAILNVAVADDTFGQTWQAPNAPALSLDKWMHLFEIIDGKKIKRKRIPIVITRIAGIFNPFMKELYEMAYQFEYPYLVNHDKYADRFGDHSMYPSDIIKQTVEWYNSTASSATRQ